MSAPIGGDGSVAAIDAVLAGARTLVMAGPGGVGKTTVAAALGVRAAEIHGRRVVVVTVDPARRLAEALGVARLTEEPVLVPVGDAGRRGAGEGRLWMLMVDMAKSWDELVTRHAPDPEVGRALLANGLYRTLTRRFVQSHDYIALDHLLSLGDDPRYDLVIVDTPPSAHALDLLDAPDRMIEFFESRLLRWLTVGGGSGITALAAKPFLLVAERLLGDDFLTRISEFFTLFARLRPAFVALARALRTRLAGADTSYLVVTTTAPQVVASTQRLIDELAARSLDPALVVVNRFVPTLRLDDRRLVPRFSDDDFDAVTDPSLSLAVGQLLDLARTARLPTLAGDCPVAAVAWSADDLTDVRGLAELLGGPPSDGQPVGSAEAKRPPSPE